MALLLLEGTETAEEYAGFVAGERRQGLTPKERQGSDGSHECVANHSHPTAVGLEKRRQHPARELVVPRVGTTLLLEAQERRGNIAFGGERSRECPHIEQSERRALPELRTRSMRRVADQRDASLHP